MVVKVAKLSWGLRHGIYHIDQRLSVNWFGKKTVCSGAIGITNRFRFGDLNNLVHAVNVLPGCWVIEIHGKLAPIARERTTISCLE